MSAVAARADDAGLDETAPMRSSLKYLAEFQNDKLSGRFVDDMFERFAKTASRIFAAPAGLISLLTTNGQIYLAERGLLTPEAPPHSWSFCNHIVGNPIPVVVTDARRDVSVKEDLAFLGQDVVAFLGVPVTAEDGHVLGAFWVFDCRPRAWSCDELIVLQDLAQMLSTKLTLQHSLSRVRRTLEENNIAHETPMASGMAAE